MRVFGALVLGSSRLSIARIRLKDELRQVYHDTI